MAHHKDRVSQIITRLALAIGLVVAVSLPLVNLISSFRDTSNALEFKARVKASSLSGLIASTPDLWMFAENRIQGLIMREPVPLDDEQVKVFDEKGQLVIQNGKQPKAPELSKSYPLYDTDRVVGRIEVTGSLLGLVYETAIATLLGLLLGSLVFIVMRVLPLRALRRVTDALFEEKVVAESATNAKTQLLIEQQELIRKLEDAQGQLLQSEKMASVGQLAAGVAHEINNPIGFINANLGSLKIEVEDLLSVIAAYENAGPVLSGYPSVFDAINRARLAADLTFVREDIQNLITESLDGVHRVKKIVDNLKDFSRVDTTEWQLANLEDGLESTLNIVWNEIKYKAEVKKEYAGLPEIECIAAQINQVFMNLLVNAAHAIEEHGVITLRTDFDDKEVWVEIEDTGRGIKPEHLNRIFEPFFTTKPVGKGTGLGLSLAFGIVQRHHGHLNVGSEVGKGTVFRLTLPREREAPADK